MAQTLVTSRNLRVVVYVLAVVALLYAATTVLSLLRRDSYHALISGLVLSVVVGIGLMAWLKSASRSIPGWLRAGCFLLALALFFVLFH